MTLSGDHGGSVGLADDVRDARVTRWTRPIVDALLGPEEAAEFAELLANPLTNVQEVRRQLLRRGIEPSEASVQKWAAQARGVS